MSGWISPVEHFLQYQVYSNTFNITTEGVSGGSGKVGIYLYHRFNDFNFLTRIEWKFSDWGCYIAYCTPNDFSVKFPVTPPTGVSKTWEIIYTTEDLKIKCNTLQVLHLIFNSTGDERCTSRVKGKKIGAIRLTQDDTVTKKFQSDQVCK